MPTVLRSSDSETSRVVDIAAEDPDLAGRGHILVSLVDAVEAPQQRRLATARGADQRGDHPRFDVDGHVLERLEIAVPEIQIPGLDREAVVRVRPSRVPRSSQISRDVTFGQPLLGLREDRLRVADLDQL